MLLGSGEIEPGWCRIMHATCQQESMFAPSENSFLTFHSNMWYTPSQGGRQDDPMAGKKTFEPNQVLEKAMNAFWERGYEGLSIEDIVQSTGIGRGSLYDTFSDKHSLYLAALERYLASVGAQISASLDQTGTLQAVLEQLFQTLIDTLLRDPARRGCFLVNASLEMAPHDPEVNKIVQSALQEQKEWLYRLLIKAQVTGDLSWKHDPHQLAHFLLGILVSIRVLARGQQDRRVLEDIAKTALSVFQ